MHEYGLCEAIAETARKRAGDRPVNRIKVRVGSLLEADDEAMEMAYSLVTAGTELGGSRLELVEVPGHGRCRACDHVFDVTRRWETCPACGSGNVAVQDGNGMILEEIEYRRDTQQAV